MTEKQPTPIGPARFQRAAKRSKANAAAGHTGAGCVCYGCQGATSADINGKILEFINKGQWMTISRVGLKRPLYFTIGLFAKELPEIVVASLGLDDAWAGNLLNDVGSHLVDGVDVTDKVALQNALGWNRPLIVACPVNPTWLQTPMFKEAHAFHPDGKAPASLQLAFADPEGRFPWEPGFSHKPQQGALWRARPPKPARKIVSW